MYQAEAIWAEEQIIQLVGRPPNRPLTFNSYLLTGSRPTLIHTTSIDLWPHLAERLGADRSRLAYVLIPHFEADECGAIGAVLAESPGVEVVSGEITARQLKGFGLVDKVRVVHDGDTLAVGEGLEIEFVEIASEIHLRNGLMLYERTTRTLFSSDFMAQTGIRFGDAPDVEGMLALRSHSIPCEAPFAALKERLGQLDIDRVAPGHGMVLTGDVRSRIAQYLTAPS